MSATTSSTSSIESEYRARTKGSAKLYAEACKVIPAGLTHDSRSTLPIRSTRRARSSATHGPAEGGADAGRVSAGGALAQGRRRHQEPLGIRRERRVPLRTTGGAGQRRSRSAAARRAGQSARTYSASWQGVVQDLGHRFAGDLAAADVEPRAQVGMLLKQQPPRSMATSTTAAPGFIALTICRDTSFGAVAPGISTAPITRSADSTGANAALSAVLSAVLRTEPAPAPPPRQPQYPPRSRPATGR